MGLHNSLKLVAKGHCNAVGGAIPFKVGLSSTFSEACAECASMCLSGLDRWSGGVCLGLECSAGICTLFTSFPTASSIDADVSSWDDVSHKTAMTGQTACLARVAVEYTVAPPGAHIGPCNAFDSHTPALPSAPHEGNADFVDLKEFKGAIGAPFARLPAADSCVSCEAACSTFHWCRGYSCGKSFCQLTKRTPTGAASLPSHDVSPLQCYAKLKVSALITPPPPPPPPSPPPPPPPATPLQCPSSCIEFGFPDFKDYLSKHTGAAQAALRADHNGKTAAGQTSEVIPGADATLPLWGQLPDSYRDGRRRCDAHSSSFYSGGYYYSGELLGGDATLPLFEGGTGRSYLWWRPEGRWSRADAESPQNAAGWVITDEPPKVWNRAAGRRLAETSTRANASWALLGRADRLQDTQGSQANNNMTGGSSMPSSSGRLPLQYASTFRPARNSSDRMDAHVTVAARVARRLSPVLYPPDRQPLGAREASYHVRAATSTPLPFLSRAGAGAEEGALFWTSCGGVGRGERVWAVLKCAESPTFCGPGAALEAQLSPPRAPRVTASHCASVSLEWAAAAASEEASEYAVWFDHGASETETDAAAPPTPFEYARTTATNMHVSSLAPATPYRFFVSVRRGGRWSRLSPPVSVVTAAPETGDRYSEEYMQVQQSTSAASDMATASEACSRLVLQIGSAPECFSADYQELQLRRAVAVPAPGEPTATDSALRGRPLANAGSKAAWGEWVTAVTQVRAGRGGTVSVEVADALTLYQVRIILHADRTVQGPASAPLLVDGASAESLLGSAAWPLVRAGDGGGLASGGPTAGEASPSTYVPQARALHSGAVEVARPPSTECQRTLRWSAEWQRVRAPSAVADGSGGVAEQADVAAKGGSASLSDWMRARSWRLEPLPRSGIAPLALDAASGALSAQSVRCLHGCRLRLVPSNLVGWNTPSAWVEDIFTPPLSPTPPNAVRLEVKFLPASETPRAAAAAAAAATAAAAAAAHGVSGDGAAAAEAAAAAGATIALARAQALSDALELPPGNLRLLEGRLLGEYLVVELAPAVDSHFAVARLLRLQYLSSLLRLLGESALRPAERQPIVAELDPHAPLLQVFDDGSVARCVARPPDATAALHTQLVKSLFHSVASSIPVGMPLWMWATAAAIAAALALGTYCAVTHRVSFSQLRAMLSSRYGRVAIGDHEIEHSEMDREDPTCSQTASKFRGAKPEVKAGSTLSSERRPERRCLSEPQAECSSAYSLDLDDGMPVRATPQPRGGTRPERQDANEDEEGDFC